jgi:hypothetical protein
MPRTAPTFTHHPEIPAPQLLCPSCDRPLIYRQTVIAGVKPPERWDYYECRSCGPFQYRHRTRLLRRTDAFDTPRPLFVGVETGVRDKLVAVCPECRLRSVPMLMEVTPDGPRFECRACGCSWKVRQSA